jgi:GTP cyclohydrolase I
MLNFVGKKMEKESLESTATRVQGMASTQYLILGEKIPVF